MTITEFLSKIDPERKKLMTDIHKIISEGDKTVKAEVGKMMGKDMILYNAPCSFKYGLASVKEHMSLHCLPIYGSVKLHEKYKQKFVNAKFQKGCINFKNDEEMPLNFVKELIKDCSKIDLAKIREEYLKNKKE
ncbi:hypothetical protein BH10BAC5_BH10BAC5_02800 [soil metagenome]